MRLSHRIRDYLVVTLITILIWIYAEGNNLRTWPAEGMVEVPLTVEVANPNLVVVEQSIGKVNLQFRGAQREIAKLSALQSRGLTLTLDRADATSGEDLVLAEVLTDAAPLNASSVNITQVNPRTVRIAVDRVVTRDVPLSFVPKDVQFVADSLAIRPERVMLRIPEGRLATLGDDPDKATLSVEPLVDLKTFPPDVEQTARARVRLPDLIQADPRVRVAPTEVELTFVIDKLEDSEKLASVPVWIMAPPPALRTYEVRLHEEDVVLRDVKVTGPEQVIQQVRDSKVRIIAKLRLSADDLAKGVGKELPPAPVEFDVWPQPAATNLRIESPATTVRYTVTERGS